MTEMTPPLELKEASFAFQGSRIMKQVSCRFEPATTTVVMGASGAGKSTLLKLAAGLMVPQEGQVYFRGKDLNLMAEAETVEMRRNLGFVFQDFALWANKTIYQNLELPLSFHFPAMSPKEIRNKIHDWAGRFGLEAELDMRPSQLSNGEQQLTSFIRGLIIDPEIILLDEPTASLDSVSRSKVLEVLLDLKSKGRTLVVVTQVPEVTSRVADRLVLIKHGRILVQGDFNEVVKNPDPQVVEILTSVLSQAATFSSDILDLLGGH